jgi:hypothetical protein
MSSKDGCPERFKGFTPKIKPSAIKKGGKLPPFFKNFPHLE